MQYENIKTIKTMEKKMFALTYCYEGYDDNVPYATTIAVSEDIEKLKKAMERCVDEDCEVDEDDEWADDKNFIPYRNCELETILQHKKHTNLYAKYRIHQIVLL